jgi:uncharacterized protein YoxC
MPAEVATNIYANYGIVGLIVVAFFVLVFWVIRTSKSREDKLYTVINTLSAELPQIRNAIQEINHKIR